MALGMEIKKTATQNALRFLKGKQLNIKRAFCLSSP